MATTSNSNFRTQITIIGILFAVFGFVTWLNGTLIPFLKIACQLTAQQSFYVATAFFAAYFFLSMPSTFILNKTGTKLGMAIGLLVMGVGCLVFIPAAQARDFNLFLFGLFLQGTGLALLQTAANPYVSVIGPIESAASRISIMGICNKTAGIIANLVFGATLLNNSEALEKQIAEAIDPSVKNQILNDIAGRVVTPYTLMAAFLGIIAIIIMRSSLPDIGQQTSDNEEGDTEITVGKTSIFQFPHTVLGALAIFMYVGAEVMAGDLIGVYGKMLGFSSDQSKYFTSFGLIGLLIGYVLSIILIPKFVKQETWLFVCGVLGIFLALGSYITEGVTAVTCLAALGFSNAVMWPAIFPLGIQKLGRFTNTGSALLVMGIVGGAIIPPLYGYLYENKIAGLDFRSAFLLIMVLCYVYILWYGMIGHKAGLSKQKTA